VKRVGLVCDRGRHDDLSVHRVGDAYVMAVRDGAGALPLLVPALDAPLPAGAVLAAFDGLVSPAPSPMSIRRSMAARPRAIPPCATLRATPPAWR
jgi:putative glutamine amidotransferase